MGFTTAGVTVDEDYAGSSSGRNSSDSTTQLAPNVPNTITIPKKSDGFQPSLQSLSVPIRPYSFDTLSILSMDGYEALARTASRHLNDTTNKPLPAQPVKGLRGWWQRFWVRNKGLAYMLMGQVFGVLMNITTRTLELEGNGGKGLNPFHILFVRMSITAALASLYMWYRETPHFPLGAPAVRGLLVARGVSGFFGVFGMYYSLMYLPLADATVITFLAPSLACWACSVLIKEPFTRIERIAAIVSLTGVVLIARPGAFFQGSGSTKIVPTASTALGEPVLLNNGSAPYGLVTSTEHHHPEVTPMQRLGAVGVALVGVLGTATVYTTIRWIGQRAHPLLTVNYFAVWCTIVSFVMMCALPAVGFDFPSTWIDWGRLLFLGTCGFAMQFLTAAGLSYEKSSRATNMAYFQMLFALAGDKFVFGITPSIMSIAGSALILSSGIVVAVQKNPQRKEVVARGESAMDEESSVLDHDESSIPLVSAVDPENGTVEERIGMQTIPSSRVVTP